MKIIFDFMEDIIFVVEADEPTADYDVIEIQDLQLRKLKFKKVKGKLLPRIVWPEPKKIWGRYNLHPVTFEFNGDLMPDLYKIIHERMRLQHELVSHKEFCPAAVSYKFGMKMFNEENEWDLIGCFLSSISYPATDCVTDNMAVTLCVDHIPKGVKVIRKEGEYRLGRLINIDWAD